MPDHVPGHGVRAAKGSRSPRILAVFEDEKALALTQRNLSQRTDFGAAFFPFFFFQTLPEFMADFRGGWRKIGNSGQHEIF